MMDMKKMINVQEAYEESLKNREMNNAKVLVEIEERILEAIKKGSFEIYFKPKEELYFGAGVIEDLRSRGFEVKRVLEERYLWIKWNNINKDCGNGFRERIAAYFRLKM